MTDQALIAHLKLSDGGFGTPAERQQLMSLEPRLESAITAAAAGVFDGDEFGGGECVWYMYGPDADALFNAAETIIREAATRPGGFVVKRRGAPGDPEAREETISL
jgi:hypothetical protein